ncbi:MAG: helix-turn-helix domain-containing protein [Propionibacteriaceae bacterium]|jgi:predicted transcriptional regulator YheO|nr:helix-turn-helix domain-containing protein [Propionibacteriaceae bacterium]
MEPLQQLIPGESEIIVHDLRKLPDSIVGVSGSLTNHAVGDAAPDSLVRAAAAGTLETNLNQTSHSRDGHDLHSATIVVEDSAGNPAGAMVISSDTRIWRSLAEVATAMLPDAQAEPTVTVNQDNYIQDVDELAEGIITHAINDVGVPVELMHKRHKLAVVADLKERGFFILRESVERAASALQVTRFTIYNYLKEIEQNEAE